MSPNYASWCGLEAYQRGVTMTYYFIKIGKKRKKLSGGASERYQCIGDD